MKREPEKSVCLIVIAGFFILLCLGVAYAWGIFIVPITTETGWTRTSVSLAVSILLLVFSLFMPVGGFLEQKIGPGITALMGGIILSAGWIMASFTNSIKWLYMTYGLLGGIGTGLSYLPSVSTGIKCFENRKGLIAGIITAGFGLGSAFLAPLGVELIELYGWRRTMFIYGVILGIIISISSIFLRMPAGENKKAEIKTDDNKNNDYIPIRMIKDVSFKTIFFTYFFAMLSGMMLIGHIVPFLEDAGYSSIQASLAITILAISNGTGRITVGFLSDKWDKGNILRSLFFIIGITSITLNFIPSIYLFYIASVLIGLCFGGFLSIYPAITAEMFGTRYFGVNYGIVFIGYGLGCFAGPLLGGFFYDAMENYFLAFIIAGIISLSGAGLVEFVLKKSKVKT
ncbi:MAG: OFA family MFS transporter [bacterium]|nr:OFA family MFS transporter [bacterium]